MIRGDTCPRRGFESIEADERFGIDGPHFAGDAVTIRGARTRPGMAVEFEEPEAGRGLRFADKFLTGEKVVIRTARLSVP